MLQSSLYPERVGSSLPWEPLLYISNDTKELTKAEKGLSHNNQNMNTCKDSFSCYKIQRNIR